MAIRVRRPLPVLLLLAVAGCASARVAPAATSNVPSSAPVSPLAATLSPSSVSPPPELATTTGSSANRPSAAARMICGTETNGHVATLAGVQAPVPTTSSWADDLYSCTYAIHGVSLVLSVKSAADPAAARGYFDHLQSTAKQAHPLAGLASLGLPGYQVPAGAVVFLKDSDVLTVDATRLPAEVGAQGETRGDLAYTLATDVLACWSGS